MTLVIWTQVKKFVYKEEEEDLKCMSYFVYSYCGHVNGEVCTSRGITVCNI